MKPAEFTEITISNREIVADDFHLPDAIREEIVRQMERAIDGQVALLFGAGTPAETTLVWPPVPRGGWRGVICLDGVG